jgi:hypothetical protein
VFWRGIWEAYAEVPARVVVHVAVIFDAVVGAAVDYAGTPP